MPCYNSVTGLFLTHGKSISILRVVVIMYIPSVQFYHSASISIDMAPILIADYSYSELPPPPLEHKKSINHRRV